MNSDFIRLKNMEGELKFTQMNNSYGFSVTTKELVFFKPHLTYHLFLHDIVSMVPHKLDNAPVSFRLNRETVHTTFGSQYYKIGVKWARIVSAPASWRRKTWSLSSLSPPKCSLTLHNTAGLL